MAGYREILPDMASLGGNSRNTQEVAFHLANKLNESEMHQFKAWLRQVSSAMAQAKRPKHF